MTDLSEGDIMIYLKEKCTQVHNGIFLTQRSYAKRILETYGMDQCKSAATLMDERCKLAVNMGEEE